MKKFFALLLALMMSLSLVACGGNDAAEEAPAEDAAVEDTAVEETPESDAAYIEGNGKLVVGITIYEPMNYYDDAGNLTGFDTEFAQAVCDKLGLEAIYVQAKRWKGSVGRPEIQQFVGALRGRKKGVFITTGTFTKEAVEFAEDLKDDPKVVLVDGRRLAELMIEHNVGVSTVRTIEIKQVDGDYFEV